MNTYRCIRKNAKALSPVVASIILIAVTVAVSVAVAAWMGGMTIGFMGSSTASITTTTFTGDPGPNVENQIVLNVRNTGTKSIAIQTIKVNNIAVPTDDMAQDPDGSIDPRADVTITISLGTDDPNTLSPWVDGATYAIGLFDANGQALCATQANAPGS